MKYIGRKKICEECGYTAKELKNKEKELLKENAAMRKLYGYRLLFVVIVWFTTRYSAKYLFGYDNYLLNYVVTITVVLGSGYLLTGYLINPKLLKVFKQKTSQRTDEM